MKTVLLLLAVVAGGWLVAILAIALFIFFVALVAWVVMTLRSAKEEGPEQANRSPVKRLVEQEQI